MLRKNDQTSDYADKIRRELAKSTLTDRDRSSLLLCLGRLYENGGDYESAFLKFAESGRVLKSTFDVREFDAQLNDSVKVLTKEVFEKFADFRARVRQTNIHCRNASFGNDPDGTDYRQSLPG